MAISERLLHLKHEPVGAKSEESDHLEHIRGANPRIIRVAVLLILTFVAALPAAAQGPEECEAGKGYFEVGQYYEEQAKWANAISAYENAMGQSPTCVTFHKALAEARKKKIEEEDLPLAESYEDSGFREDAKGAYKEMLKVDPDNAKALQGLDGLITQDLLVAEEYVQAGLLDDAKTLYKGILKVDPDNLEARNGLADLVKQDLNLAKRYGDSGLPEDAKAVYQAILKADPDNPDALSWLEGLITQDLLVAEKYVEAGLLDDAKTLYKGVLKVDPDNAEARNALEGLVTQDLLVAEKYVEAGLLDDAKTIYKGVLKVDPNNLKALKGLDAVTAVTMGNPRFEMSRQKVDSYWTLVKKWGGMVAEWFIGLVILGFLVWRGIWPLIKKLTGKKDIRILVQAFETGIIVQEPKGVGDALRYKITHTLLNLPNTMHYVRVKKAEVHNMVLPKPLGPELQLLGSVLDFIRPRPQVYEVTGAYFQHDHKVGVWARLVDANQQTIKERIDITLGGTTIGLDAVEKLAKQVAIKVDRAINEIRKELRPSDPAILFNLAASQAAEGQLVLASNSLGEAKELDTKGEYAREYDGNLRLLEAAKKSREDFRMAAYELAMKDPEYFNHFQNLHGQLRTKAERKEEKHLQDLDYGEWKQLDYEDWEWEEEDVEWGDQW